MSHRIHQFMLEIIHNQQLKPVNLRRKFDLMSDGNELSQSHNNISLSLKIRAPFLCEYLLCSIGKQKQRKKINAKNNVTYTQPNTYINWALSYIKLTRPGVNDRVRPKRNCFKFESFFHIFFLCSCSSFRFFSIYSTITEILLQLIGHRACSVCKNWQLRNVFLSTITFCYDASYFEAIQISVGLNCNHSLFNELKFHAEHLDLLLIRYIASDSDDEA